jgi:hypothetical protein
VKKALLTGSLLLLTAGGGLAFMSLVVKPAAISQTTDAMSALQVELLNPGAEPRQIFRLRPKLQTKQLTTITQTIGAGRDDFDRRPQSPRPGIVAKVETTVTEIERNGNIRYQFRYTDLHLIQDVLGQLRSQLAAAKNVTGEIVIDNRGQIISTKYQIPEGANDTLQELVNETIKAASQPSIVLPEMAIGIGAKWQIAANPKVFGTGLPPMTTTYELVNLQDGTATLNISATLLREAKLPSQKFPEPAFESSLTGQGQIVIQLDQIMPINSKLVMQTKSEIKQSSSGTNQPTAIHFNIDLEIVMTSE